VWHPGAAKQRLNPDTSQRRSVITVILSAFFLLFILHHRPFSPCHYRRIRRRFHFPARALFIVFERDMRAMPAAHR
jgi:hypothetical protein